MWNFECTIWNYTRNILPHISRNVYFIQTLKFDFVNVLETSQNYSVDWTLCTFLIHRGNLTSSSLQYRQNGRDSVSNHQPHDCFLFHLFRHRSKKTSKLCVTGLCMGISPEAGEFPAQMASYAENVSIWWRHHVNDLLTLNVKQHIHVVRHGRSNIFYWQVRKHIQVVSMDANFCQKVDLVHHMRC